MYNYSKKIVVLDKTLKDKKWMSYYCNYDYESWKPPLNRVNWIISQIENPEDKCILDVGCGAYPVSQNIKAHKKVGMDISLKAAENVANTFDKIYICDLNHIKKEDCGDLLHKFDYIILAETLEHFENAPEILIKMKWFLKDTGKLIITYPNHFSLSMYIDFILHNGKYKRYVDFMEGHFTFYRLDQLKFIFKTTGYKLNNFNFRPCDLIPEKFPKENNKIWKLICRISPHLFAHQFMFTLSYTKMIDCFPKRFNVVIDNGVRIVKEV